MGIKSKVVIVLFICMAITLAGAAAVRLRPVVQEPGDAALSQAFAASGAHFQRMEVNGWSVVNQVPDQLKEGAGAVTASLKSAAEWELKPGVRARLTLQQPGTAGVAGAGGDKTYLIMSLVTEDSALAWTDLDLLLEDFMKGQSFHRSVIVSGYLEGRKSPAEVDEIVSRMLQAVGAEVVQTMKNERLVSIAAFTPNVRERLTLGDDSVNINMAVRYNSIENKTLVYVGSPIINSEY